MFVEHVAQHAYDPFCGLSITLLMTVTFKSTAALASVPLLQNLKLHVECDNLANANQLLDISTGPTGKVPCSFEQIVQRTVGMGWGVG